MKCFNCLCFYNKKDKCILKKIIINEYGDCECYKENIDMINKWCKRYVPVYLNDDCKMVRKENFKVYR